MLIIYIYFVLKIITKYFNLIISMFGNFSNNSAKLKFIGAFKQKLDFKISLIFKNDR